MSFKLGEKVDRLTGSGWKTGYTVINYPEGFVRKKGHIYIEKLNSRGYKKYRISVHRSKLRPSVNKDLSDM